MARIEEEVRLSLEQESFLLAKYWIELLYLAAQKHPARHLDATQLDEGLLPIQENGMLNLRVEFATKLVDATQAREIFRQFRISFAPNNSLPNAAIEILKQWGVTVV